jgi:hypothetical protein
MAIRWVLAVTGGTRALQIYFHRRADFLAKVVPWPRDDVVRHRHDCAAENQACRQQMSCQNGCIGHRAIATEGMTSTRHLIGEKRVTRGMER